MIINTFNSLEFFKIGFRVEVKPRNPKENEPTITLLQKDQNESEFVFYFSYFRGYPRLLIRSNYGLTPPIKLIIVSYPRLFFITFRYRVYYL